MITKIKTRHFIPLIFVGLVSCNGNFSPSLGSKINTKETLPREIMNHHIANRGIESTTPKITVSKFIELAERIQSCQCAKEKFVNRWENKGNEYKLQTFFSQSEPIIFICNSVQPRGSCYIREIDRGKHIKEFKIRFASGNELVKYIYDNGIKCKNNDPCVD